VFDEGCLATFAAKKECTQRDAELEKYGLIVGDRAFIGHDKAA
jgi:hypothetical protein